MPIREALRTRAWPPAVQSMLSEQGPPDTERAFWGQSWVSISGTLPTIQGETEALSKEGQPGREEALRPVRCWPLRTQVSPSAAGRRCWTGPRSHRSQAEPLGTSLGRGRPQNSDSEAKGHEDQPRHLSCYVSPHCRHIQPPHSSTMACAHSGSPRQEHPSFTSGRPLVFGPSSGAPTLDCDNPWAWAQSSSLVVVGGTRITLGAKRSARLPGDGLSMTTRDMGYEAKMGAAV